MPTFQTPADIETFTAESWGDANERGKEAARALVTEMRAAGNPTLLGHVVKTMVADGVFGGYEVGYLHAISEAAI